MRRMFILSLLLCSSTYAQTFATPTQVAAAISVHNTNLNLLIYEEMWDNKSGCKEVKGKIDKANPYQNGIDQYLKENILKEITGLSYLYQSNMSNLSALKNLKKAYEFMCLDKSSQNTLILVDIYRELATKDVDLAGIYLNLSDF